jgi:hypothetical protein
VPPREWPERLPRWTTALLAFVACLMAAVLVWHAVASWQLLLSRDAGSPVSTRLAAADKARSMEPWNPTHRAAYGYVLSQKLFAEGRHSLGVDVMAQAYRDAVGDAEMLVWFKHIQDVLTLETNRKAHLQHGHEGPGGTLKPGDIER